MNTLMELFSTVRRGAVRSDSVPGFVVGKYPFFPVFRVVGCSIASDETVDLLALT
jgi:hypothetical protein